MQTRTISRREYLKSTGALIVSFSFSGPVSRVLAQSSTSPGAEPDATSLDSWLAVSSDGIVTV
ncbi:MAG TPA: hypothetical protein VE077_04605, partial [Candidatus Methylomirabilis sp.]|nr:hypothetical protein [Candidatus Methylomirabilis sp.]HYL83237.1 hypothetical protein [Candidatus Angelobacter sp.]